MKKQDIINEAIDWTMMLEQGGSDEIEEAVNEVLERATEMSADWLDTVGQGIKNEINHAPSPNYEEDDYNAGVVAGLDIALTLVKDMLWEVAGRKFA